MGTNIDNARWEMIEAGGRTCQSFGLNPLFGQMYMLLYLSREPLCLDQLAERLGVSKASISIVSRQLESWGAIRRVWKRGDRRYFFEAEMEIRRLIERGLLPSIIKKLDSARHQIERSLSLIDEADSEDAKLLRDRLADAERRRARLESLIDNPIVRKLL